MTGSLLDAGTRVKLLSAALSVPVLPLGIEHAQAAGIGRTLSNRESSHRWLSGRFAGSRIVTMSPGLSVRLPEPSSGTNVKRIHARVDLQLLALAIDRDGLNAGEIDAHAFQVEERAIQRMVERLLGGGEFLALRQHRGRAGCRCNRWRGSAGCRWRRE